MRETTKSQKVILLGSLMFAMCATSAVADDITKTETTVADTWVRSDKEANNSTANAVELQTVDNTKWFYGLFGFSLPGSNYTITSAQLCLTTERVKGDAGIIVYGYDNDFAENTTYNKEKSHITTALNQQITTSNTAYGVKGKTPGYDKIDVKYKDLSSWQTTIDLTNYANSWGSTRMNIMIVKSKSEIQSTKFYTKEAKDVTVSLSDGTTTTWAVADLKPQLTLVYTLASHTLTVTDAGAATLVLPYEATIPEGVKTYTLTYTSGDAATATELSGTIPANTPVLINAEAGDYTFNATETQTTKAASPVSGALTGVWAETTIPEGSYVLQNQDGTVAFYKVSSSDIKCPANCAYLTASASAKALSISYGGSTTGISNVAVNKADGEVYNLQGVRMKGSLKKGLYIQNGKKFVVK